MQIRYDWPNGTLETVNWEARHSRHNRQDTLTSSNCVTISFPLVRWFLPTDKASHCIAPCARLLAKISPTFFVVPTTHVKRGVPLSWTVSVRNVTGSLLTLGSQTFSFQDYRAGSIKLNSIQPTTPKIMRLYSLSNRLLAGSIFSKDILLSVGNASNNIITWEENLLKAVTALPGHGTLSHIYTQTQYPCVNLVTNLSMALI
jgi:hypothetical protein